MLVIGLTGGISSGKSTVAKFFAAKGVPVIDADDVARQLTRPDQPALQKIVDTFGTDILLPDKQLNRTSLGKIIFSDTSKRKALEEILHPLIRAEMKSQIESLKTPYCIAMIPLLLETAPNPLINRILVVDTSKDIQISRTMSRDNLSRQEAENILNTQIDRQRRISLADDLIENNANVEQLTAQVDKLHEFYLSLANP